MQSNDLVIDYLGLCSATMLIFVCINMECEAYFGDRNGKDRNENKSLTETEWLVHTLKRTMHGDNR